MVSLRCIGFVLPVLMLIGTSGPGQAKDYPYSGYFAFVNSEFPGSLDTATCAFSFFHQRPDGTYTSYHIDLALFKASKAVRYVEFNRAQCTYSEFQRI